MQVENLIVFVSVGKRAAAILRDYFAVIVVADAADSEADDAPKFKSQERFEFDRAFAPRKKRVPKLLGGRSADVSYQHGGGNSLVGCLKLDC